MYLVPALAKLGGIDFEQLGISVCSVGGTNFEPYVKLLGPDGLNMPFAVITDGDPLKTGSSAGLKRVRRLLAVITGSDEADAEKDEDLIELGETHGIFVGDHTFEIDLFKAGRHRSMCSTLSDLTNSGAAKKRAKGWRADPTKLDADRFIRDINAIGKGRFAQRLATRIVKDLCPSYISDAIEYLKDRLS